MPHGKSRNKGKCKTGPVVPKAASCSAEGFVCSGILQVWGVEMVGASQQVAVPLPILIN